MKKIISLFKRNYETDHLVRNEVVEGAEWVLANEGRATVKWDGTAVMVRKGKLFKRHDRKLKGGPAKRKKQDPAFILSVNDFKDAPQGWEACEEGPDLHTGHWPGWIPVGEGPEDRIFRLGFTPEEDGTYEFVGEKINGNPHGIVGHRFFLHGDTAIDEPCNRTFQDVKAYLAAHEIEGIVWHHPDGRMVKIKRRDFGLPWPIPKETP